MLILGHKFMELLASIFESFSRAKLENVML